MNMNRTGVIVGKACWGLLCALLLLPVVVQAEMVKPQMVKPQTVQPQSVQPQQESSSGVKSPAEIAARIKPQSQVLRGQLSKLDTTLTELRRLLNQPLPKNLSVEEQREWREHSQWLNGVIAKITAQQRSHQKVITRSVELSRQKSLGEAEQQSLLDNMQNKSTEFLALQNAIQMEARRYQTLSNAVKVRHDVAMSSIRNMK